MPFRSPNQQCQRTEVGNSYYKNNTYISTELKVRNLRPSLAVIDLKRVLIMKEKKNNE